jgi:nitrate reductase molybdenum cofactor assembly chaperone NarJ/NarW
MATTGIEALKGLQALSILLSYPTAELANGVSEVREVLSASEMMSEDLESLLGLLESKDLIDMQEMYVDKVDRGKGTSLYLFEHLLGESKDRGTAMVNLKDHYFDNGYEIGEKELPDYLPVILEFASTLESAEIAKKFIGETVHITEAVYSQHLGKTSPWAAVLGSVLQFCDIDEKEVDASEPEELDLDKVWEDPVIEFGGDQSSCNTTTKA